MSRNAARRASPQPAASPIGERFRELRAASGMTLERLAAATGLTKGYLSKIQNSRKLPPIATLSRIAQALGIGIGGFFGPQAPGERRPATVVRARERRAVVRGGSAFGYDYEGLAHPRVDKRMEPFIFTFPPRIDQHVYFEHEGEEFVFVLSGRVAFQVGDERFTLGPGDSLYFDSAVPHRGWSLGREAKALVVMHAAGPAGPARARRRG